jgi:hypothetical protein
MKSAPLLPFAMAVFAVPALRAAEPDAAADPSKVDADYAIQGEYEGELDGRKRGVQVVALGDGAFDIVGYRGGLPGAGWDGDLDGVVRGTGQRDGKTAVFRAEGYTAAVENGAMKVRDATTELGILKRVERTSPTLGAKPPPGAVVLFDGTNTDAWKTARMTPDGLLMQGAITKQQFQDFTVHVEFRTSYQPKARGQGRGNSGVYAQGRYEVQVLDSFGLKGEHNECGGIYSVRAPDVNMCLPPLQWQTYDIEFTAARFDAAGKKMKNARLTVKHNGVLVHSAAEADHSTAAAEFPEGPAPGPITLQDHGNPVRYRNVWVVAK